MNKEVFMCLTHRFLLHTINIFIMLMFIGSTTFAQKYEPKVDNFIFLYDMTSSMDENYQKNTKKKAALAREAMQNINQDILELGFTSGLYEVVPDFKSYQGMFAYDTNTFEFAIAQLPLPARHLGPQTSLAEGLGQLAPILKTLSGSTALIVFSDGGENKGGAPATVLEELYGEYDICFHFVSYAQEDEESDVISSMQALHECSQAITGDAVLDDQARKDFVQKIFYRIVKDSDGDGVIDAKDLCPDTPAGVEVDEYGCPVDSDGDGVPDYLDKCPDTPMDLVVDEFGCPIAKRITLDIKFDFDKAEIKPEYRSELKKIADILNQHPEIHVVVEGHTDSIGSEKYNDNLSKRRASRVALYLEKDLGISPDRFSIIGYGETKPTAGNTTQIGRQKNRRVEGVFPEIFQKK